MSTKKIIAKYVLYSVFEIPADATDWSIHWDKISYTKADGTEVEDEGPVQDCKDDHEVYHRPSSVDVEEAESEEELDVDDRDAPNVYPYKQCCKCSERKSCGQYVEDDWYCEDCAPEEDEEEDEEEDKDAPQCGCCADKDWMNCKNDCRFYCEGCRSYKVRATEYGRFDEDVGGDMCSAC